MAGCVHAAEIVAPMLGAYQQQRFKNVHVGE
jgi:hypothetical protein